jgi:mycothiol synthase
MEDRMTIDLPPGLEARAPTLDDLDDVIAVVVSSEVAADGVADITYEDLRSDWERPSFDLENDAVVVVDGSQLVAYAEVFKGRAWVHVHLDARDRGIGAALLRWTEERARALGSDKLGQTVSDNNRAAGALLSANRYSVRWYTWVFEKALEEEPESPPLPDGVTLRTFEPGRDDRAMYELIDTAFSDWTDRDPSFGFEDWAASYIRREDFDPTLTFLLEDQGRLNGASMSLIYGDVGWVQQLAVDR